MFLFKQVFFVTLDSSELCVDCAIFMVLTFFMAPTQVPVEHGLLIENLLDLAHAPFTHTSTFAKVCSFRFDSSKAYEQSVYGC